MAPEKSYKRELETLKEDFNDLKLYLDELRSILPISICTLNPFWVIVDINKATEILTGYRPLEIIGQPIDFIFREKLEGIKEKAEKWEGVIPTETILSTKNKKEIPISISLVGRRDPEGNLIGYFLSITDITETKKYQKQLEERTKELQEKIEELEKFQKFAVGRELKMVALKEEIEKLRKELEKYKGRT